MPNRHRILVWFNEHLEAVQLAVAVYDDEEKLRETTWSIGPFDSLEDHLDRVMIALAYQPHLV